MADTQPPGKNDDDLLADAIPIPPQDEDEEELSPIEFEEVADAGGSHASAASNMIRTFGDQTRRAASGWKRKPVASGKGACHVRTFVTKLRLDAMDHMDEQINEWLDQNPDFDVKFVTTTIGKLVGKNTEDALFVNVWV